MTVIPNIFQPTLPIDDALPKVEEALRHHSAVVLSAPPGSGKTTRVPLSLLNAKVTGDGLIVMLEPRRVAARSVAFFMAATLNETIGQTVGYQVRMERRMSKDTRILVVTEGILTRRFISDPLLEDIGCVIIDEFHERSVHVDMALCLLKEALTVRDDLKVIVMSATINATEVSGYLDDCPIVNVEGTPYPLQIVYASERTDSLSSFRLDATVASAVLHALNEHPEGDVLAFLPGAADIEKTCSRLQKQVSAHVDILLLYGALSAKQQDDAVRGGEKRRVVLATNIAETSLTIPNVRIVVDAGLEKRIEWRSGAGFEKLVTGRISQFSATQRAGRAARTAPGTVYRLWHASQARELSPSSAPEILRTDPLSTVVTLVASFCKAPGEIDLLTPLRQSAVEDAVKTLQLLDLLNDDGTGLTEKGKLAIQLPTHPRLALVIIAATQYGCLEKGAAAAAIIEERQMLDGKTATAETHAESCDIEMRINLIHMFRSRNATRDAARMLGINYMVCRRIMERMEQFKRVAASLSIKPAKSPGHFILPGFWDRVCKKNQADAATGVMSTGRGVALSPSTQVRSSQYFLAIDAVSDSHRSKQRSEVTLASGISPSVIETEGARFFSRETELELDDNGKVVAFERTRYMQLLWQEERLSHIPKKLRAKVLATRVRSDWKAVLFANDEQKNALCRLALARHLFASLPTPVVDIPVIDGEGLAPVIEAQCEIEKDITSLKRVSWANLVIALLPYQQQQQLVQWFPHSIALPSGRRTKVDYTRWFEEKTSPVIRVKLQELFGLQITPPIANGKMSLSIALLAPNGREVQITNDLKSFWENTYPEVRKELRARYAKHFWPEDPLTAVATHLTQKQFSRQKRN